MNWKKIGKTIIYPPIWVVILLTVISAVALPLIFIKELDESIIGYVVYVIAFYIVCVICVFFAKVLPRRYKEIKQKIYNNPLGNKYMTDATFKVKTSLYVSLVINLGFSIYKLISAVLYSSFWSGAEAIYYILLSIIRFLLLKFMHNKNRKKDMIEKYRRYRLSAILMMLINLILSAIVLNMILKNKSYEYSDVYVIASATYTFYTLTVSIIDIVKYRKYKNPILSSAKALRFATALVSLLSLETVMLMQFGDDESFRRMMTALTGAGIFIIVLGMSVYMIVKANKEIKKLRSDENERT